MIDDYVRRLVDAMPPLTEKQRERLALLFSSAQEPRSEAPPVRRRTNTRRRNVTPS